MSRRVPFQIAAVVFAAAIAFVSALPTQVKHAMHTQGILHPWLHLLGFAALTAVLLRVTRSRGLQLLFLGALLLFGYATEARESKKDGWPIEQMDVRLDAEGVLLGAALGAISEVWRKRARRHPRRWRFRPPPRDPQA